jgi:cytidylate kinase
MERSGEGHPAVVTIAALYGASGTIIGPRVAERLGVSFLDREIPQGVAERAGLPEQAVASIDEAPRSFGNRLVDALGRASNLAGDAGGASERLETQESMLRSYFEDAFAEVAVSGGVAVGRGGMVVLRRVPWALHVHLGGPREARVAVRMAQDGIDRPTAERRQKEEDGARYSYVRRAYGVAPDDPSLYHLMLDTTAVDADVCVDLIVLAADARRGTSTPATSV